MNIQWIYFGPVELIAIASGVLFGLTLGMVKRQIVYRTITLSITALGILLFVIDLDHFASSHKGCHRVFNGQYHFWEAWSIYILLTGFFALLVRDVFVG